MGDKQSYGRVMLRTTDEYARFNFHMHNRVLRNSDGTIAVRKDLFESMRQEGFRMEEPITAYRNEDGTLTVIDGHNRLVAAQALGIPVHYIAYAKNGRSEWTPLKHSKHQRNWGIKDYMQAYAAEGKEDYAELAEFCDRTGILVKQAASMMYANHANSSNAAKPFKEGAFRVKDRKHPEIVADIVSVAHSFARWAKCAHFVGAVSACLFVPEFSPLRMKEKITKHHEHLEKPKNLEAAYDNVEHVYNFASRSRMPLKHMAKEALAARNKISGAKNQSKR